jgi:hypothetical protein
MGPWCDQLTRLGADPEVLLPVVFPELLRSSVIRDEAEALGMAVLYVNGGARLADFSVGRFQMKPSFAEALEAVLPTLPDLPEALSAITRYPEALDERGRRAARLGRLRDQAWQLRYLAAFEHVVEWRSRTASQPTEVRIRFLAAAYNRGFWFTAEEIRAAGLWRLFPRAGRGAPGPYRYADVAVDFYERIWRDLRPVDLTAAIPRSSARQ